MNPAIVQKELKDISLSGGVNESVRPEKLDWTKYLTTAQNVVPDDEECLVKRLGYSGVYSTDEAGGSIGTARRCFGLAEGVAVVAGASQFNLYQLDEGASTPVLTKKGPLSEVTTKYYGVDAFGAQPSGIPVYSTTAAEDVVGCVLATSISSRYIAVCRSSYFATSSPVISVADRETGQVVRTYTLSGYNSVGAAQPGVCMVFVDDRYLHVFWDVGDTQNYNVIDSSPLPSSGERTGTSLPSSGAGISLVVATAISGFSQITLTNGTNSWVDRLNPTASATSSLTINTYRATGGDVDGTNTLILVGINAVPNYVVKKITISSMAVAATVTDGVLVPGNYNRPRIAVDSSGNMRMVTFAQQTTVTAGVSIPTANVYSMTSAASAFTLVGYLSAWIECAHPFCFKSTNRFYLAAVKTSHSVSGGALSTNALGQWTLIDVTERQTGASALMGTFRPVAILDSYTGRATTASPTTGKRTEPATLPSVQFASTYTAAIAVESKNTAYSRSYEAVELNFLDSTSLSCASNLISGGILSSYDGRTAPENNMIDQPSVFLVDSGGGGGPGAGTYNYVAVYQVTDSSGRAHYSKASAVSSIVMAGGNQISVQCTSPRVGGRPITYTNNDRSVTLLVFRTTNGGTQYFLSQVDEQPADGTVTYFTNTLADGTSDATLAARPPLYRQPGTPNTNLDRYPALSSVHVITHKDRIFYCHKGNVYYSSFMLDGEATWFNPGFTFLVPGGSGDVTGLASMDGQLIIFKRDGIWIVDGDGPPENGGNGTEFSPPRRILTEFGCIDQRSIVATSIGLMYRSTRGIELLSRSMQVVWLGANVVDTVDANPYTGGAVFDKTNGRVMFAIGASQGTYPGLLGVNAQGVVVVYDVDYQMWTVFKYTPGNSTFGCPMQDICYAKTKIAGTEADRIFFADPSGYLHYQQSADYRDSAGFFFVPIKLESGWIKLASIQDRMIATDFLLLAKKATNHNLTISVAYDYSDSYTYSKTWTPADINVLSLEQLELQIPKPMGMAIRIKIEDAQPADTVTYPVSTGKGPEIFGMTVRAGTLGGGAKLANGAKG